ncbi:MAG: hypothetical protein ACR2GN_06890 [Bacteroidia bacterium]
MKYFLILLLIINTGLNTNAQNLIGFTRALNSFYVFDNGTFQQLEHRPVKSFEEGAFYLAYINDKSEFRIYKDGRSHYLDEGSFVNDYTTTNYLMTFLKENQLNVWDNNRIRVLTTWVGDYTVTDSLVTYYDDLLKSFRVYYNNRIYNLEPFQNVYPVLAHKTGKNILAYIDRNNNFNIFYNGVNQLITRLYNIINFDAGRDIVAYEGENEMQFRFFYKGNIYDVEEIKPLDFQAGDEIVAYTDAVGNFKIFDKGTLHTISRFSPSFYDVKDDIVIFADTLNYFSVYSNGKTIKLEEVQPRNYLADLGNVAYLDFQGRLKIFTEGKVHIVSYERVENYRLRGNVLVYETGSLTGNIWYKGNVY